jgi:hypothetical protein
MHGPAAEYNTSNHNTKRSTSSFTRGDGIWATCMSNSKCCKYLLLFTGLNKTVAFYSWINNFYLLHTRLNNCYMMVVATDLCNLGGDGGFACHHVSIWFETCYASLDFLEEILSLHYAHCCKKHIINK